MTERDDGTRQEVAGLSDEQKALHAKILAGKLRGSSPPIRAGLSVGPERLSASQLDFWIADKLCPDTALNNLSCIVQIHKRLDVALFRRSVDALVERHDALRTSIEETSGEPRQVVRPVSRIDLPCTDLRHLPQSARVDVALGAAREILMRPIPFDGELFRVALWQLEDDVFELLLVMHHAISDGWSIGLFLSDLMETYAAEESGQAQSKGASPTRYVDYVRWLEDDTGREARTRSALEFWRTAVADTVKPATLAFDHDARTGLLGPGERLSVTIAPELRDAIKRAQRECQVSPSTIILAAVGAVLARLSGVARPVVGLYMSSRRHPATHGTIGAFVHTIPVPVDLTADPDVRTTLKAIHSFLGRAIASEPINVGRLASALGVPRSDGQSPFFRVAVSMQHTLDGVEAHGLRFRRVPYESSGTALYDVLVNVFDRADGLILALDYRKDRYESETIDQFARALELVLSGAAASLDARMTTLPIPTADRRAPLESDAASRGLAWWTERLSGMSQLDLPYDRVATAPSHAGDAYNFTVPLELVRELEALAHEEKCTLYETLLAGWVTLMHRYTGQTDFPVGTLAAGRELAEERAITGLFANTLVLRCDVSESPSFVALMHRLQGVVVHSLAHQHVPFDQVVRALGVARTGDLNPLIQSMFVQVPPPGIAPVAPGMSSTTETAKIDGGSSTIAKYNLCLAMAETAGGLRATLEYATDLFDRSSVERMATHFEMILRAAVERPSTPIGELSLLTVEERHRLMVAWNSTAAPRPDHRCVPELFTERARLHPDRVALECRGERVTYGELDRRSNRLARHLVAVAVGPGSLVGICVERSTDMIVGLLAIAKAGGAYIPLDPGYPSERIAYVLEDSKADVLLTTEELLALFPRAACRVVRFRDAGTESEEGLAPRATENDLAYAIYTSGSTGKPKGVAVHHAALVNTLLHFAEELEFTEADTVLGLTSLSFDIAGLEIWLPLITGGTIDLLTREEAVDGRVLMRELDRATVMQATPATWQILLDAGWKGGRPLRALCGGEAMPWSLATALAQRATRVWNVYGPTETTIWSTTWEVDVGRKRVAVGRGIANTQIYVLDKLLQPVPVGIPGEVYIAGVGVGRGYLHRPSLTDEKFVPNPFADAPGARMYSTGDTGRWASDGSLEHIGRTDDQVKIRGFRVELGEIETVLSAHASVRACAVVVRHEAREAGGSRLVAFVVGDVSPTERDEVREYLARVLPPYMVPSAIVVEAELPLLPNGKVDRRTLTVKAKSVNTTIEAEVKPQTATEASLAGIWKRVLDREEIDVRRTFFEQGGTSLQLVRVQRMIGEELGADLTVADFFRFPTVEELAKHLEHANAPGEKLAVKDDVAVVAPARSTIADETDQLTAEQVREQLRRTLETLSES